MVHLTPSIQYIHRATKFYLPPNEDHNKAFDPILLLDLETAKEQLKVIKPLQRINPFRQVSPELFISILSACDSPSLATAMSICSTWKKSALNSLELFLIFKMKGTIRNITAGLMYFKTHSTDSIETMELEVVGEKFSQTEMDSLSLVISHCWESLKTFSITMKGDPGYVGGRVASNAPVLEVLKSINSKVEKANLQNSTSRASRELKFSSTKVRILIWHQGPTDFTYGSNLLSFLKLAQEVELKSLEINETFITNLLTSCKELRRVKIHHFKAANEFRFTVWPSGESSHLIELDLPHLPDCFSTLRLPSLQILRVSSCNINGINSQNVSFLVELTTQKICFEYTYGRTNGGTTKRVMLHGSSKL